MNNDFIASICSDQKQKEEVDEMLAAFEEKPINDISLSSVLSCPFRYIRRKACYGLMVKFLTPSEKQYTYYRQNTDTWTKWLVLDIGYLPFSDCKLWHISTDYYDGSYVFKDGEYCGKIKGIKRVFKKAEIFNADDSLFAKMEFARWWEPYIGPKKARVFLSPSGDKKELSIDYSASFSYDEDTSEYFKSMDTNSQILLFTTFLWAGTACAWR